MSALTLPGGRGASTERLLQEGSLQIYNALRVNQYKKNLVPTGTFAGLWVRTAHTLSAGGFQGQDDVRAAITSGTLRPFLSIRGYGLYAHREVLDWLSIRSGEMGARR